MLELRREPRANWHVVYVDVQGVSGPADWVAAVMAELAVSPTYRTWLEAVPFGKSLSDVWQRLGNAQVTSPFLRVELRSAMGNEWPDTMDRLQARLSQLPEANAHLLIIVDELPVLVADAARGAWTRPGRTVAGETAQLAAVRRSCAGRSTPWSAAR